MSENPNGCNKDGTSRIVAKKHRRSARPGMAWCFLCALALGATLYVPSLATTPSPEYLRTLTGHNGDVNSVAFSPDGTTLASGSRDFAIGLWRVSTGRLLRFLTGHTGYVNSVAFSPDGTTLASGSDDKTIRLWNVETGSLLRTLAGHSSYVYSVAFSPDGTTLASGANDSTIKLWNAATGSLLRTLTGHNSTVSFVAFSPDGTTLASGSADKTIRLWNVETGSLLRTLTGHAEWVGSVAFSPDGTTLASGSGDGTIRLWSVATGSLLRTLTGHSSYSTVSSVAFSPDGTTLASGSSDDTIKLWNAATGSLLRTLTGHTDSVHSVAFSPDGATLASGAHDNTIKLWDVRAFSASTSTLPCPGTYSISPMNVSAAYTRNTGTIRVTAQSECSWAASSKSTWIHITSGPGGSGSGTVTYSVDANPGSSLRIGTLTIAGATCTITQSALPTPPYSPLDVRWEARWECNEARGTCSVSIEVTVENTGYTTSTGTVCWVGLNDVGNWYYAQTDYRPVDIKPGEKWTFTPVLVCPLNIWTRIDIQVRNNTGVVFEEESRAFFIP
jgi:WD40 repeat protein